MAVRKNTLAYMFITVTERIILHMASPNGQLKSSAVSTAQKGRVSTNWKSVTAKLMIKKLIVDFFRPCLTLMRKNTSRFPPNQTAQTTEYTTEMSILKMAVPSALTSIPTERYPIVLSPPICGGGSAKVCRQQFEAVTGLAVGGRLMEDRGDSYSHTNINTDTQTRQERVRMQQKQPVFRP
ncbi:hypothetical protein F7725_026576 [Dissostichus mawsoni]|uniref:Uncharacterized protein n=1 Tax=Dissostichus mawsoni TaxID=36200 RepID=A0A7J5X7G9_DISMA|nr:hypothetical protein F7725_026576 [Dissostichus mawsoni]